MNKRKQRVFRLRLIPENTRADMNRVLREAEGLVWHCAAPYIKEITADPKEKLLRVTVRVSDGQFKQVVPVEIENARKKIEELEEVLSVGISVES